MVEACDLALDCSTSLALVLIEPRLWMNVKTSEPVSAKEWFALGIDMVVCHAVIRTAGGA